MTVYFKDRVIALTGEGEQNINEMAELASRAPKTSRRTSKGSFRLRQERRTTVSVHCPEQDQSSRRHEASKKELRLYSVFLAFNQAVPLLKVDSQHLTSTVLLFYSISLCSIGF